MTLPCSHPESRRLSRRALLLSQCFLLFSLLTAQVAAQPARPPLGESLTGSAQADYNAGRILYQDGDYASAALKFQLAYDSSGDARLLWNMAAARKGQRKYAEVERLVKRYVHEGALKGAEKARALELLATIRAFVAEVNLSVSEPNATVFIDGERVGETPLMDPLRLDIGERTILVKKAGFEPHTQLEKVTGNTNITINLLPESNEGQLRIISPVGSKVTVDGRLVTGGTWEGPLAVGRHRVVVTEPGKRAYSSDALVEKGKESVLQVDLQDEAPGPIVSPRERESSSAWIWIGATALVLAGGAAATYYLLQEPEEGSPPDADEGSLDTYYLKVSF